MHRGDLRIRPAQATDSDLRLLSAMNRALIEDEGSRNPMSFAELGQRMEKWIRDDWIAAIFEVDRHPVGYILFQIRRDEYDESLEEVYIRQFYVDRARRRTGIGRTAFQRVRSELFPGAAAISLDVLSANHRASDFWRSLGFQPYCMTMKLVDRAGAPDRGDPETTLVSDAECRATSTVPEVASIGTSPHYAWGAACDGWHLLRSDALSVIQERMPVGAAEVRHRHRHTRQFFFVLVGQLAVEIEGVHRLVPSREGVEVPPEAAHEVRNPGPGVVEFLVISQPSVQGDREMMSAHQ